MPAYLLLIAAILSRVLPHPGWYNVTAVGGSLLFFGARRKWAEMLVPVAALAAVDWYLTAVVYGFHFVAREYLLTWAWYAAAMALGRILLRERTSFARLAVAIVLGPTSFFLITNFAAWLGNVNYPQTPLGLVDSYVAGLPFYRNDLLSTGLVCGLVFGAPLLAKRLFLDAAPQPEAIRE